MVDTIFRFLITIVLIALLFFLCIWVFGAIGIMIPPMVEKMLYVLAVLVVLLIAWRFFGGFLGASWGWWGPPGPRP